MFFIDLYTSIDRFLIRTRVKYLQTLKFLDQTFLTLAQYFSMDRRTIVPILSNFRHFSMLLQFILNVKGVRSVYHRLGNIRSGDRIPSTLSINEDHQSFRRYCKNNFFELTKIFCFNVKETGLRAVVDSVIIIFKI
jgi:hypothetical protein